MNMQRTIWYAALIALNVQAFAETQPAEEQLSEDQPSLDARQGIAPDIREDDATLRFQRGDFVLVPIPISNPTLDTGLVLGGAYFYGQTEGQKLVQPASVTAGAGMYTSNDSRAAGLVQQNYWGQDKWRFTGAAGAANLKLTLLTADETSGEQSVDWRINGSFLFAKLSRKLAGDWYGGFNMRMIDAEQSIETDASTPDFDSGADVLSSGLGVTLEHDSRDMPINSYAGRYLKLEGLFNDEAIGSDKTYQSYSLVFRSYHALSESVVLAWEAQACTRGGTAPLWDACRIHLRGFSTTDYLGKDSASTQAEARWQLNKRWGLASFAGVGFVGNSANGIRENEPIPSYGAGLRFMVLPAKRINLRVDFAWSEDSDAVHVSVGEAF